MAFINLNKKFITNESTAGRVKSGKNFKKPIVLLAIILVFILLAVYLPLRSAYQSATDMKRSAQELSAAIKRDDLDGMRRSIKEMKDANDNIASSLNWLFWVRAIPIAGGYYGDMLSFMGAFGHELTAVQILADTLDPFKNELGFTGQPVPGQDKISQAVKVLNRLLPQLDMVEPEFKRAKEAVANINTAKYPEKFGKYQVRNLVEIAKNFIIGVHYAVAEARPAIEVAPSALGEPAPKTYLVIFQNDKEIRATGGFMTAYAFLKLDKGRISSSTSDDIYRLDEKLLKVCLSKVCPLVPPEAIVKYLPEANGKPRTVWAMRDANLSPDLPTSMKEFERMYGLLGEGLPFDGIIMIDTHVVEKLINITGPIDVFGTRYSADADTRCNCPNVIFELERYAQVIEKGEPDRKAILGTLMQQILARSIGVSTDKAPEFINAGVSLANSKHIMFYMHDEKVQQALSKLNWTGETKDTDGDYLYVNDVNFAGGKSNLYVEEEVILNIETKKGEKVKNKLTVNYKNPQPYNTWLNGINRDYVRVYVPQGAKLLSSKGSDVQVTTKDGELKKTVFEAFIQVRPQNSRTLEFEYELPINLSGKEYPLLIQKQPGTKDFKYTIKINGKNRLQFNLSSDQSLKLPL